MEADGDWSVFDHVALVVSGRPMLLSLSRVLYPLVLESSMGQSPTSTKRPKCKSGYSLQGSNCINQKSCGSSDLLSVK